MAELDQAPIEPIEPAEPVETAHEPIVIETARIVTHKRSQHVYGGMWGPFEIAAISVGALALLASFIAYFFLVIPSNRELEHNKNESDRLSAELISANTKYGQITDTQSQVDKILTSVDDFETRFLPTISTGQSALYQRLNGLIHGYGLVNTTGPDYAPLEIADTGNNNQTEEEKGRAKFRSLYPGVYVTMTVEGSYANLRRFISEIEAGREFVVISAVELAPSDSEGQKQADEKNKPAPINTNSIKFGPNGKPIRAPVMTDAGAATGQFERPRGKVHGEYLALHLEMAAYFKRPGSSPMSVPSVEQ